MSYAFVNQLDYSQATGVATLNTATGGGGPNNTHSVTAGNILIVTAGASATPTLSDSLGNFSSVAGTLLGNGLYYWTVIATVGGTASYIVSEMSAAINGVLVDQYSGIGSATPTATGQQYQNGPTPSANCFIAPASAVTLAAGSYLLYGTCFVQNTAVATAGTSPIAFTGRGQVWGNYPSISYIAEDAPVTSSGGTYQVTFGSSGYYQAYTNILAFPVGAASANPADGYTASGTSCSTGTGGAALPAIAAGDLLDVLVVAQTSSTLSITSLGDGSNTYTHISALFDQTSGYIWDHWYCMVTVPLSNPVVTVVWNGSAKLNIAVGRIPASTISASLPFAPSTNWFYHKQTGPSGANSQVSGYTPTLVYQPATVAGWGFSTNQTAAPAAGTGFTQVGTCWASLGGACLTYETQTVTSTAAVQATFTPVTGNTYSFVAAFNNSNYNPPPPVAPPGPMPKQIYVMP